MIFGKNFPIFVSLALCLFTKYNCNGQSNYFLPNIEKTPQPTLVDNITFALRLGFVSYNRFIDFLLFNDRKKTRSNEWKNGQRTPNEAFFIEIGLGQTIWPDRF